MMRRATFSGIIFSFVFTGVAIAQTPTPTTDACIAMEISRKIANVCDFKEGVPAYSTRVRTLPSDECPPEILVEYTDPATDSPSTQVANRRGTNIETCGAGIASVRIKSSGSAEIKAPATVNEPPQNPPAPAPQQGVIPPESPPAKKQQWVAVAGSIYRVDGDTRVAVGFAKKDDQESARKEAIAQCQNGTDRDCNKVRGPFNKGCLYITTSRTSEGIGMVADDTLDKVRKVCETKGYICKVPIGGCVDVPGNSASPAPPALNDDFVQVVPPAAPPAKKEKELWIAVAGSTWNTRNGKARAAIGFAKRDNFDDALDAALAQCKNYGGQDCKVKGPVKNACLYITTGSKRRGAAWFSASTITDAREHCESAGYTCKSPIGDCVPY